MWHMILNLAAAALIVVSAPAGAQQAPPRPKPTQQNLIEAPIGHRQPRAQDLPRKVLQDEGMRTSREIELDKQLNNICRGC
jgi:hypothetical protein